MVIVTTVLPGASPKEIEQILTIPMEEEIAKIDDIDEINSTSTTTRNYSGAGHASRTCTGMKPRTGSRGAPGGISCFA